MEHRFEPGGDHRSAPAGDHPVEPDRESEQDSEPAPEPDHPAAHRARTPERVGRHGAGQRRAPRRGSPARWSVPRPVYHYREVAAAVSAAAALALLGSVLLTVDRLVAPQVEELVQAASFAAYATIGYAIAAALLVLLLLWRPSRRRVPAYALVVAVVGLVLHLSWLAPYYLGGRPDGPSGVTVMASNLDLGNAYPDAVVRAAAENHVDVLVLEEVTRDELTRLDRAGLSARYDHRAGRTSAAGSRVTMVFSTYPLLGAAPIDVSNGGVAVTVAAPEPFRLLAVHTSNPSRGVRQWADDLHRIQVVASSAVRAGPTVVAGDFNATADHARFRRVLATGLGDAVVQADSGWQPTWPSRFRKNPRHRRGLWHPPNLYRPVIAIDHVLTTPGLAALGTRTVEIPGSDHLAVVARLSR